MTNCDIQRQILALGLVRQVAREEPTSAHRSQPRVRNFSERSRTIKKIVRAHSSRVSIIDLKALPNEASCEAPLLAVFISVFCPVRGVTQIKTFNSRFVIDSSGTSHWHYGFCPIFWSSMSNIVCTAVRKRLNKIFLQLDPKQFIRNTQSLQAVACSTLSKILTQS